MVKVKSMATQEIGLNEALAEAGVSAWETDLAELIVQLGDDMPSHILVPAIHRNRSEIREIFRREMGNVGIPAPDGLTDDPPALAEAARLHLRNRFLTTDMSPISGANFGVAETGTVMVVESEGNGRMCLTLPRVLVTVMGYREAHPHLQGSRGLPSAPASRSSTGERMNPYTTMWTGVTPGDGPEEFHLVLLDNGRSTILADPEGPFGAALHSLLGLSQRVPGLRTDRRPCLRLHLPRSHRGRAVAAAHRRCRQPLAARSPPPSVEPATRSARWRSTSRRCWSRLRAKVAADEATDDPKLSGPCSGLAAWFMSRPNRWSKLLRSMAGRSASWRAAARFGACRHRSAAGPPPATFRPHRSSRSGTGGLARDRRIDARWLTGLVPKDLVAGPGRESRQAILDRVRAATCVVRAARPWPVNYRQAGADPQPDLRRRCSRCSSTVSSTTRRTCHGPPLPPSRKPPVAVAGYLAAEGAARVVVPDGFPDAWRPSPAPPGSEFLLLDDDAPLSRSVLDTSDGVITGCAVAVAETGTIVLDGGGGQGRRALTLLPDLHVVIVTTDQLVARVPDALIHLDPRRPLTWISGPSATSDIELNRVEGVHGPRRLRVVVAG